MRSCDDKILNNQDDVASNGVLKSDEGNVNLSHSKRELRKLTRSFNKAAILFLELDLNDDHIETFRKEFINLTMLYVKLIDLLEIFVKLSKADYENDEKEYSEKIDWLHTQ